MNLKRMWGRSARRRAAPDACICRWWHDGRSFLLDIEGAQRLARSQRKGRVQRFCLPLARCLFWPPKGAAHCRMQMRPWRRQVAKTGRRN